MTDTSMTSDLIERLSQATQGSWELSDKVLLACGWTRRRVIDPGASADYGEDVEAWYWDDPDGNPMATDRPSPTESIDAALTLVPEGWAWIVESCQPYESEPVECSAAVWNCRAQPPVHDGATPALALCIAALRARYRDGE